ncbi:hypothetical protein N5T98_03920 [Aliarcobacter cryaerophilus]|mgnify:FL=1|uniref:ApeA N-terminal domain 1-containing protein n=1 Tax=Aliarcobacter cryaerophilus TaxID=28198 RepID=UPI0021B4EA8D|nr:hypothetical protein [Aliarcobacter cryaerophilus]MCT7485605.1 hypothetical protein [Aliarcobacter cryaerophilus]MCT7490238.1 hypothetical protein [Aliarcobacter cryaerophilus]
MNKIDKLFLNEKIFLDVKVQYDINYWVAGKLNINQKKIILIMYGELNAKSSYKSNRTFKKLICTNYLNSNFILLDVKLFKSQNSRLNENIGSFYDEYEVSEILFNSKNNVKIDNFIQLSFSSKDLQKWIQTTNLQRKILDNYLLKEHNNIDLKEVVIDIENMYLIIHYPTTRYLDSSNNRAGIKFKPTINLSFQQEVSFEYIRKKYFELLNLLYLVFGYDLNIDEINLLNDESSFSYFYKQKLDRTYDKNVFIPLGHNLKFNNNIMETPLSIFQNYFKLDDYKKSFFKVFRKYKMFHYTEDKFLGYFRILENLMFDKKEKFTESYMKIYLENINLSDEEKLEEKSKLEKNLDKSIIDRKEKIKFIVFHNKFINVVSDNYKLKVNFTDVEEIVKLRNDISHFNDYKITQNNLEKYIDYLEILVNYVLLRLIGYSDESFLNNMIFYPYKHRIFDFKNN